MISIENAVGEFHVGKNIRPITNIDWFWDEFDNQRKHKHNQLTDKRWFMNAYIKQGKSQQQIAKEQMCALSTVTVWRKNHRIPSRRYNIPPNMRLERDEWEMTVECRKFKAFCRQRDHYTCQMCGTVCDKYSGFLHIHHKAAFAQFIELRSVNANGICLCRECHYWVHSNDGKVIREAYKQQALAEIGHLITYQEVMQ